MFGSETIQDMEIEVVALEQPKKPPSYWVALKSESCVFASITVGNTLCSQLSSLFGKDREEIKACIKNAILFGSVIYIQMYSREIAETKASRANGILSLYHSDIQVVFFVRE